MRITHSSRRGLLAVFLLLLAVTPVGEAIAAEKTDEAAAAAQKDRQELDKKLKQIEERVEKLAKDQDKATLAALKDQEKAAFAELLRLTKNIESNSKAVWYGAFGVLVLMIVLLGTWLREARSHRKLLKQAANSIATLVGILNVTKTKPQISSINPSESPTTGGAEITIEGQNFDPKSMVAVGGQYAPVVKVDPSRKRIAAATPAGKEGEAEVTVETPDGQVAILERGFKYVSPGPGIDSFLPTGGSSTGAELIMIAGVNFREPCKVNFGPTPASAVEFVNPSVLKVQTPKGTAGESVKLTVVNPDNTQAESKQSFTFR
jgi:hypothetical protein